MPDSAMVKAIAAATLLRLTSPSTKASNFLFPKTSEHFPALAVVSAARMSEWSLLTNHARALLLIARDPDARLRDLAAELEVTERTAFGIVTDLTEAGYLIKEKNGRRNRYQIQTALPVVGAIGKRTIGEVLELLGDSERTGDPGASNS